MYGQQGKKNWQLAIRKSIFEQSKGNAGNEQFLCFIGGNEKCWFLCFDLKKTK